MSLTFTMCASWNAWAGCYPPIKLVIKWYCHISH